jgi:hypothetical protein
MRSSHAVVFVLCFSVGAAFAACGSRTGLPFDEPRDGAADAASDAPDATVLRDARDEDAELPPIEASTDSNVVRDDCLDASATLVYLITTGNELLSFNPPAATFRRIGGIACPAPRGTTPFSMAVDRQGLAYTVFNDGRLYRVRTSNAACEATSFVPNQLGFSTFGMGFATREQGPDEDLYIAADGQGTGRGLARVDIQSLSVNPIGRFSPDIAGAELTGTGDGRLFAFYANPNGRGTFIAEVNKETGELRARTPLTTVDVGRGWAFAFWGGDFYMFTSQNGSTSEVTRFRPADGSVQQVARYSGLIVGAGVSTCAPQ